MRNILAEIEELERKIAGDDNPVRHIQSANSQDKKEANKTAPHFHKEQMEKGFTEPSGKTGSIR